jgi:hypothetical protein
MEHLVTDESVAAHHHAGRYLVVLGARVLDANLTAPPLMRARGTR